MSWKACALVGLLTVALSAHSQTPLKANQIAPAIQGSRVEFRISGVPAVANPFDSDASALDAVFTAPSGRQFQVPGFWYQGYTRWLSQGYEVLSPKGSPDWRLRFTPTEIGRYALTLSFTEKGSKVASGSAAFTVAMGQPTKSQGFVRVATDGVHFATPSKPVLPLVGMNMCWPDSGGTFDYDRWFGQTTGHGQNYTRIWMVPWSFGIEDDPGTLTNYRLDHAWALDRVFSDAETDGVYLLLTIDYNGMFAVYPDNWGGNNYWPENPYNSAQGGPCSTQDDFFTSSQAQHVYEKRLRYLIARYGYSTQLFAWEFFNEIDDETQYLSLSNVPPWLSTVGNWLHAHDPYRHLVTTSYVDPNPAGVWSVPAIDFAQLHAYAWSNPAQSIPGTAVSLMTQYGKPVLTAEFGVSGSGWNRQTVDPYLRGLRQGIWGGFLGGTAGTAMSWWWDNIFSEGDLSYYTSLGTITDGVNWTAGGWSPFQVAATPEDQALGPVLSGAQPTTATISLDSRWGANDPGTLALAGVSDGQRASSLLNAFVQGSWHPDLKCPFRVRAWYGSGGAFVVHVNSTSYQAELRIKVDGNVVLDQQLPDLDGDYAIDEEYNQDFSVPIPPGKHLVEVDNPGTDWIYLDYAKAINFLPASYLVTPGGSGIRNSNGALIYFYNPTIAFPANATTASIPTMASCQVTLSGWQDGTYNVTWSDPSSGAVVAQNSASSTGGILALTVPAFTEDLVANIQRQ